MAEEHFYLQASWPGGRNSHGHLTAGQLETEISIPPEMDGPGIGTNPDEMLLGAAATCYLITLAAMIERADLPLAEMSLDSEGIVDVTRGVFTYQKIIHKPYVALQTTAATADYDKLKQLVTKAEEHCMISRALRGNVTVAVQEVIR